MKYSEPTVKTEKIYDGRIINVRRDTVKLCNGAEAGREIVEHPGGVCVVACTDEGKILIVKQFRKPFDEETLEIPAGKLDYGEAHYDCGLRELKEETGYTAGRYIYIGEFYPTPGFCNEKIHIYYADNLTKGEQSPDEDEFLEVYEYTYEELLGMIMSGEIHDCKTVIGILMMREMKEKGKI